jgi:hypothetical protein
MNVVHGSQPGMLARNHIELFGMDSPVSTRWWDQVAPPSVEDASVIPYLRCAGS